MMSSGSNGDGNQGQIWRYNIKKSSPNYEMDDGTIPLRRDVQEIRVTPLHPLFGHTYFLDNLGLGAKSTPY